MIRPGFKFPYLTLIIGTDPDLVKSLSIANPDTAFLRPQDEVIEGPMRDVFLGALPDDPHAGAVLAKHQVEFPDVLKDFESWLTKSYGTQMLADLYVHSIRQLGTIEMYDRIFIHDIENLDLIPALIRALPSDEPALLINLRNLRMATNTEICKTVWLADPSTEGRLKTLEKEIGKN